MRERSRSTMPQRLQIMKSQITELRLWPSMSASVIMQPAQNQGRPLLYPLARCRERGFDSFGHIARVVLDKLAEPGCNVRLCDVDVVPSSHGGRAMPPQPGERESVHPRLSGPRPERVTPAVELERLQLGILHGLFVRMLKRDNVSRIASAGEHERGFLRLRFRLSLAPL